MKIVSWNVNGLRAVNGRNDLERLIKQEDADVVCLQEIKCSDAIATSQLELFKDNYPHSYFMTSQTKKGYSGTAILCKVKPNKMIGNMPSLAANDEGRIVTIFYDNLTIVNVYTPNSGSALARLEYRVNTWDKEFYMYMKHLLSSSKNVVITGDLNVAHRDIDIHNPSLRAAGNIASEKHNFDFMLTTLNLRDAFRIMHPDAKQKYSYWSNFHDARTQNKGWRIDYYLVSRDVKIKSCDILMDFKGSDHAPITLDMNI